VIINTKSRLHDRKIAFERFLSSVASLQPLVLQRFPQDVDGACFFRAEDFEVAGG
jgi:hypothetical protein